MKFSAPKTALLLSSALVLSSCLEEKPGFDFFEAIEKNSGSCTITSALPSASTLKVPFNSSNPHYFGVVANKASCQVSWTLNGSLLPSGESIAAINSSDLAAGPAPNVLVATLTDEEGNKTTRTWTVTKNVVPVCSSLIPATNPAAIKPGEVQTYFAAFLDGDGEPISGVTWKYNNNSSAGVFGPVTTTGSFSSTTFLPTISQVGAAQRISVSFSDGLDEGSCSWTQDVLETCVMTSSSPSSTNVKIANASAAQMSFGVIPNNSSCAINWQLNGSSLVTNQNFVNIVSSQLVGDAFNNILTASMSDGNGGLVTRSWTIVKNRPPVCGTMTPASPTPMSFNQNRVFNANFSDLDLDSISGITWGLNGSARADLFSSINSTGSSSNAIFAPTSAEIGLGQRVNVTVSDPYDSTTCSWTQDILDACAISSATPSGATSKIAKAPGTVNYFGIVPNQSRCSVSWSLNGTVLSASAGQNLISLLSSQLLDSPSLNVLTATVSDGAGSTASRTWQISKNNPPTCGTKNPSGTPAAIKSTENQSYSITFADADSDSIPAASVRWAFNTSTSSGLFNPITTTSTSSTAQFNPTSAQVGTAHRIEVSFNDTWDSGSCFWLQDVQDPSPLTLLGCNPNPASTVIVHSTGAQSSKNLSIAATGSGLSYEWKKNSVVQTGSTAPVFALTAGGLTVGSYTFTSTVTDQYSASTYCQWTVKRNAPPVIASITPSGGSTYRLNTSSTLSLSITATDENVGDSLSYTWQLDGASAPAMLASGSASTTFTPANDPAGLDAQGFPKVLGAHVLSVTVSDGSESVTQSWNIEVNAFSTPCNTLYNGSVATAGGKACTLVGDPRTGDEMIPADDQTVVKVMPSEVIDDGNGNFIISDELHHGVLFYNRSASTVTFSGKAVSPGQLRLIVGNGSNGITQDEQQNTAFKLNTPRGIAYDSETKTLYIADQNNHRVAAIDSNGFAATVFGRIGDGSTNSNATNADGLPGTSHLCGFPADVHLVNYGGKKWLYVSCYNNHVIKRLNLTLSDPNYGKGYIVVGQTVSGVIQSAFLQDGTAGGATGVARTVNPWALDDDGAGNLYWTDQSSASVRLVNLGSSTITAFQGQISQPIDSYTTSINTTQDTDIVAYRVSGANVAPATFTTRGMAPQPSLISATSLALTGPTSALTSSCVPYRVAQRNSSAHNLTLSAATEVSLAAGSGTFFSDSSCTTSISSTSIPAGTAERLFFYRNTTAPSAGVSSYTENLTASATGLTASSLGIKVASTTLTGATTLRLFGLSTYFFADCQPFVLQAQNDNGEVAALGASTVVRLRKNGIGTFYSSSDCSGAPITDLTLSGATTLFSYSPRVIAAPNQVITVLGGNAQGGAASGPQTSNQQWVYPTSVATTAPFGAVTLRVPRGLALHTSAPGSVSGIFVSNWDLHRIFYANLTGSPVSNMGGLAIGALGVRTAIGVNGGATFNTDGPGGSTNVNVPFMLSLNTAKNRLLITDRNNFRVRDFDFVTSNGQVTTQLGAGRTRGGYTGDALVRAPEMYLNLPGHLAFDSINRRLYISDVGNSRIRRLDMLKGLIDTAVGKGGGVASIEDEDPKNVLMIHPTGLFTGLFSGTPVLLYAEQNIGTFAANTNCMIRAWNLGSSPLSLFGSTVAAGRVRTLAGDLNNGCGDFTGAGPATSASIRLPHINGLDSNGTSILVTTVRHDGFQNDSNDSHCILRLNIDGQMGVIAGDCKVPGNGTGSDDGAMAGNSVKLRLPTAVAFDPQYAADGNFFFLDSASNSGSTRIRYANFRTTPVTMGDESIPAGAPNLPYVKTIKLLTTPVMAYGLAVYSNQICVASGNPGDGNNGSHNVRCYNRTKSELSSGIRIGPRDETLPIIRGGAPTNLSAEGDMASNILMNSPYGLSFDADGNLYIADRRNHLIRFVRRWNDTPF